MTFFNFWSNKFFEQKVAWSLLYSLLGNTKVSFSSKNKKKNDFIVIWLFFLFWDDWSQKWQKTSVGIAPIIIKIWFYTHLKTCGTEFSLKNWLNVKLNVNCFDNFLWGSSPDHQGLKVGLPVWYSMEVRKGLQILLDFNDQSKVHQFVNGVRYFLNKQLINIY